MAERGAFLVPTLVTYEVMLQKGPSLGLSEFSLEKLREVAAAGLRSVELAVAAGVPVGFGTDLLGDLHAFQSDEFAIRSRVQSPAEVLRSATEVNARIVGREGKLGVIKPGATADLIACRANPLQDLSVLQGQGDGISVVMKEGRIAKALAH